MSIFKMSLKRSLFVFSFSFSAFSLSHISFAQTNLNKNNVNSFEKNEGIKSTFDSNFFSQSVDALWKKYVSDLDTYTNLKFEHETRELKYGDKTMRFTVDKIGQPPSSNGYPLYIALHGGGNAPSGLNDWQWSDMTKYYKTSVGAGVYVAPRGVTDTWNLHFVDESYPLYDRLIEDMVLFEGVDPNRVYLLGFSAGGDGVYQVVPRMADRFAAANMSAGHHNWISFDNLYNTPFVIQVGELDALYSRNTVAAENYLTLKKLNEKYHGGYTTDVFIHAGYSHNGWPDNSAKRVLGRVIDDPAKWLKKEPTNTAQVNTNAIDWVDQFTRNPLPTKIVWDLSTRAKRVASAGQTLLNAQADPTKLAAPQDLFYWLDVSVNDQPLTEGKLIAEFNKESNEINITEVSGVNQFRVLLNEQMLNFSKPITVKVEGKTITQTLYVKPSVPVMTRTLHERSDKNFVFDSEFTLQKQNGVWTLNYLSLDDVQ